MATEFDKYIGIPYKNQGRDINGIDCLGLVNLIFKNERNIVLPDFLEIKYTDSNWRKSGENHILENISDNWKKINLREAKKYDIHIFYDKYGVASHLGMNIGNRKFIHVNLGGNAVIGSLDIWKKKIYATMRFRYA